MPFGGAAARTCMTIYKAPEIIITNRTVQEAAIISDTPKFIKSTQ